MSPVAGPVLTHRQEKRPLFYARGRLAGVQSHKGWILCAVRLLRRTYTRYHSALLT